MQTIGILKNTLHIQCTTIFFGFIKLTKKKKLYINIYVHTCLWSGQMIQKDPSGKHIKIVI